MSDSTTIKVICPVCQGTNCFKTEADGASSYLCMRCGRTTNTHFKDGSSQLEAALEKSPDIIHNLQYKDPNTELVWIPSVINIPTKELFFAIVHPDVKVDTKTARKILPNKVNLSDAINQWGNIAALTYGFYSNDIDLIRR